MDHCANGRLRTVIVNSNGKGYHGIGKYQMIMVIHGNCKGETMIMGGAFLQLSPLVELNN